MVDGWMPLRTLRAKNGEVRGLLAFPLLLPVGACVHSSLPLQKRLEVLGSGLGICSLGSLLFGGLCALLVLGRG